MDDVMKLIRVKDRPRVWTGFLDSQRSEVLTSVTMKNTIFWDVRLFSPGDRNILLPSSGIKSEVTSSFEDGNSAFLRNVPNFNQTEQHHILGDSNLLRLPLRIWPYIIHFNIIP
jgi:hypothetical protein